MREYILPLIGIASSLTFYSYIFLTDYWERYVDYATKCCNCNAYTYFEVLLNIFTLICIASIVALVVLAISEKERKNNLEDL